MNLRSWYSIALSITRIAKLLLASMSISGVYAQSELVSSLAIEQGLVNNEVTSLWQDRYGFLWMGTRGGLNRYDGYAFKLIRNHPKSGNNFTSQYIEVIHEGENGNLWVGTKTTGLNRYSLLRDTIYHQIPPDSLQINIQNIQALHETNGHLYIGASSGLFCYELATDTYSPVTRKRNVLSLLSYGNGLWVGTDQGLFSYEFADGKFKQVVWDLGSSAQVTSIARDPVSGLLYLGTWRMGVLVLDPATGRIVRQYRHEPGNEYSLSNNNAYRVFIDAARNVWIGTWGGGLNRLDIERQSLQRYRLDPVGDGISQRCIVLSIIQDRSGILWVGTDGGGIYKIDPGRKRFNNIQFASYTDASTIDTYVQSIFMNEDGLWVGTRASGAYLFSDHGDFRKVPSAAGVNSVRGFFEHGRDLWMFTNRGIVIIKGKPDKGNHLLVTPNRGTPEGLSGPKINAITRDRQGTIWVGTQESGLNKVIGFTNSGSPRFRRYFAQPGKDGALQNERISCMLSDSKGRLWMGTYNGLHLYDHERDRFTVYRQQNNLPACLTNNTVLCITEDQRGGIWIGTQHGFNKLTEDKHGKYAFENHFAQNGFPNDYIHAIQPDRHDNIWMSTNNGIVKYDTKNSEFQHFDTRDGLISNVFSENSSFLSNRGEIYFGSIKGITSFFPDSIAMNKRVPQVYITGLAVNNEDVTVGDTIAGRVVLSNAPFATSTITLSYKQNIVTLKFAALDYHAPDKNQYAYKLSGFDQDWVYAGDQRQVTYTNLPPGNYRFTVMASNSDKVWNEEGTSMAIKILPPPWKTWWAYSVYVALLIAFLWLSRHIGISRIKLRNNLEIANLNYQREHEVAQVRSKLFTNVSHEFRTPLTLMMGPLSELSAASQLDGGTKSTLSRVLNQAKRLLHLVNQLLAFQKAEASSLALHVNTHDLTSIAKYVADSFSDEAERRNIQFSVDCPTQICFSFDKEKIEIILYNLLSNAFKFTPDGGRITLSASLANATTDEASCEIRVADSGTGIREEDHQRIFERYYQAEKEHADKTVGTGIGLAFARELVGMHGGRITVDSLPGMGSTFYISLPAAGVDSVFLADNPVDLIVASDTDSNKDGRKADTSTKDLPVVLIVEDNSEIRDYLASLVGASYNVIQAADGQHGLEIAFGTIPDLIISDIMMPSRDGFSLCQQLRDDQRTSHIPIVLLTARSDDDACIEGISKGADVYLTKPFNPQVLKSYVKNLIALRQQLREQFARHINLEQDQTELGTFEEDFIKRIVSYTEEHLASPDFNTDVLAEVANMSRSTFYRKLKAITGLSGSEFIKLIRLKRSAALLKSGKFNITQAAYETGFNDLKHFRRSFQQQFGLTPSDYLKQHKMTVDL
ncbi:hybrid sensor histidine kinase/response regulator transcription factor [Parapedobacter indicus]|uniref:histidine kinase n=1 Tax=Parapedobacter indicus TaxID=1477437 RepID=A0A1I3D2T7_9SPHI|nr:hybrid sensor histidine kinase/response regulator transcription factor [Parapedobacter indicus]PPL04502.1 signal transduction histidine kinase [Parapedobacter indicus]SFH80976.1 Signal transduction histidine kinase [Parapedobacter indicus]